MHKMSNLEYSYIINELSHLAGKHLSRIRKIRDGLYRMKIGSTEIICEPGVRIHATSIIEETIPNDKFADKVEKELDNAKLISIEQINNDRIIAFNFNSGRLIFEMFAKGNAVLVKDGVIASAMNYESWSSREIKAGSVYKPPDQKPESVIGPSEKYIIVTLMKLPYGKEYSLEVLQRLAIDEKTPTNSLSANKIKAIEDEFEKLKKGATPYLFYHELPVDYALCRLSKYSDYDAKECRSLSEAADEYYSNFEEPDENLMKLQKRLEKQEERLASLIAEEKKYKEMAERIYENYELIESKIQLAKEGKIDSDKKEKTIDLEI